MSRGKSFTNSPTKVQRYIQLLLMAASLSLTLWQGAVAQAEQVPPGFEALLEKQTTLLDVYFANEFLMTTLAEYNSNEVEFKAPREVADRIPRLTDRNAVAAALTGPLDANTQLRCYSRTQTNCGVLQPEIAGIIFDEDRFRVDVFVSPLFVTLQTIPTRTFLPPADSEWSFLQNFSNAFAGDDNDAFDVYTFTGSSLLSYNETRFLLTTSYANISDWTADDILVRRDFQGREYQAGYFRTVNDASLRFVPEFSLRGGRAASTLDTRTDLDTSTGRELTIFLVNRSRVSLFKDGRLVSSRSYDSGNQVIDTSRLPAGAYPILIRIEDASGRTREEQRFYVKSSRFPPADQMLWGVELGEQVVQNSEDFIPEDTGNFFGRVSISKRIMDNTALNGGIAALDNDGIFEVGLDQINPFYDIQLNAAAGSNDGYGLSAFARTRLGDVTINGNYRETWADGDPRQDFGLDDGLDNLTPEQVVASGATWFLEDSRQTSALLTWYYRGGTLQAGFRNTRLERQPNISEYSVAYNYTLFRSSRYRLEMNLEASEFNDLTQVLVSLRLNWDRGRFTNNAVTQYQYRELNDSSSQTDTEYEAGTVWRTEPGQFANLTVYGRASHRAEFDDATAGVQWRSRFGELDTELRHERRDETNRTSHAGIYYTSFAWGAGGLALGGGGEQTRGAILVVLEGEDTGDVYFDIMIDNARRGTIRPGSRSLITMQPFDTYQVSLIPRGTGFVSFEDRPKTVTLYPGNVATLTWDVSPVHILFGQLLDQDGRPVADAVLRGAAGLAMTDSNGYFQAEVKTSVSSLLAETRDEECELPLPAYEADNGIASLGILACQTRSKQP